MADVNPVLCGQFSMMDSRSRNLMFATLASDRGAQRHSLLWATPDLSQVEAAIEAGGKKRKMVVVLPLSGLLEHTQSFYGWMMGGTDLTQWGRVFDSLVGNSMVKAIVINAATPGGTVFGTPETARKVFDARNEKPIVSIVNPLMASAGYYIGSAAGRVYITPSGEVGSLGTVQTHQDISKMLEAQGVSIEIIKSGEYKWEGHPYGPLSEETRQHFQAEVDQANAEFTDAVAKHRGVTSAVVKKEFGDGRVFMAKDAVNRGMVDRVATLEQVLKRLDAGAIGGSGGVAADDWESPLVMGDTPVVFDPSDASRMLSLRGR